MCNRQGMGFACAGKCLRIRRLYQGFGMEVLTSAEMERADRLTIAAGTPGFALMLSAGQAVAEAASSLVEEGPILVVAGPGNNGADALVGARYLMQLGYEPDIYMAAKGADCNELCRAQLEMMQGLGASVSFLREQSPEFFRSGLRAASPARRRSAGAKRRPRRLSGCTRSGVRFSLPARKSPIRIPLPSLSGSVSMGILWCYTMTMQMRGTRSMEGASFISQKKDKKVCKCRRRPA